MACTLCKCRIRLLAIGRVRFSLKTKLSTFRQPAKRVLLLLHLTLHFLLFFLMSPVTRKINMHGSALHDRLVTKRSPSCCRLSCYRTPFFNALVGSTRVYPLRPLPSVCRSICDSITPRSRDGFVVFWSYWDPAWRWLCWSARVVSRGVPKDIPDAGNPI